MGRSGNFWSVALSSFAVAAVLPILVFGVLNSEKLTFLIGANQPNELRIWIEPAEIITKPNVLLKLKVIGGYDDPSRLIPLVNARLAADGMVVLHPDIKYEIPFRGRAELGIVEVEALKIGTYSAEINQTSVYTGLPDLPVVTSGAKIEVKP